MRLLVEVTVEGMPKIIDDRDEWSCCCCLLPLDAMVCAACMPMD